MERRGSDILREQYSNGGFALDDGMIEELATVIEEFEVRDVFIKGTPRLDYLQVTLDVDDIDRCGTVVKGIAGLLGKQGATGIPGVVNVFAKGMPWPDAFTVQLNIGSR